MNVQRHNPEYGITQMQLKALSVWMYINLSRLNELNKEQIKKMSNLIDKFNRKYRSDWGFKDQNMPTMGFLDSLHSKMQNYCGMENLEKFLSLLCA